MTDVWCVLRSGGEYRPDHVARLRDQVAAHLPGAGFRCLTDMDVPGSDPLRHDWPGWWAKMALFDPCIAGDLLFMDLDSAVVGDLSDMISIARPAIMRDVYRPAGLQSSVMYLTERARASVWARWMLGPAHWMRRHARGGDQEFLEGCGIDWALWQSVLPGQVVSFKAHVRGRGLPLDARFVAFHGKPRPWDVGW